MDSMTMFFCTTIITLILKVYPSESDCRVISYKELQPNKALLNHTFQEHTVITDEVCQIKCYMHHDCVSYNLGPSQTPGMMVCQLNDADRHQYPQDYQERSRYSYRGTENKCNENPCTTANQTCKSGFSSEGYKCLCPKGYTGEHCEKVYSDCEKLRSAGYTADGVYQIDPDGQGSFPVYCDMTTDGGGWTVFQRNQEGSLISFFRGWQDYKTGFGNLSAEFWLGLEKIHRLTKRQATTLRVDIEDMKGNKRYALYSSFSIANEGDFYRLRVSGYSGTAGDSIATAGNPSWINNNMRFSTPDVDNDNYLAGSCAKDVGGWWYNYCTISDLNGRKGWWSLSKTLKKTEMKQN